MPSLVRPRTYIFWLSLCAGLLAFCVQSGELGSADTMHRLQTAHSFWTSEPAVFPNEYPEFGVHGRGGKLYDWYGIGQPVLLLSFDIVGTGIAKLPFFDDYDGSDPTVRNIFVTYTVNILLSIFTAVISYRLLMLLGIDEAQSAAGVLALLFCTTHLHYTQNMMENNYILLLTLTGFCFQYEWLRTGRRKALLIGSFALGLNLLTRLTTALDLIAVGLFLSLALWFEREQNCSNVRVETGALVEPALSDRAERGNRMGPVDRRSATDPRYSSPFRGLLRTYSAISLPIYLLFLFLDRLYQFHRFGSWTNTYVHYFTIQHRLQDPTLPAKYPWETPFHIGFLGPFISPEKSIFMFDPLIVLTVIVAVLAWKRFNPAVKAYVTSAFLLVLAYVCLYARYTIWSGDFAWGDRYVSSAVEMAAMISVPLLLKFREQLGRAVWITGMVMIGASLIIQLASLAFWMPLEIYQADDFGHPQWIIWLRFKNIIAFALGKMGAWGLNTDAMTYDQWDYQHITTWNFLPFVLKRIGAAPTWAVDGVFAVWGAASAGLLYVLFRVGRILHDYGRIPP